MNDRIEYRRSLGLPERLDRDTTPIDPIRRTDEPSYEDDLAATLRANAREPHMAIGGRPFAIEAANAIESLRAELTRAQAIIDALKQYRESLVTCPFESTPQMRARIDELSCECRDDFDRAVQMLLGDFNKLLARTISPTTF